MIKKLVSKFASKVILSAMLSVSAAALLLPATAGAQTYGPVNLMNGGTNNVGGASPGANGTTNTYGTSLIIDCTQRANVGLSFSLKALQTTNIMPVNFVFKSSLDASTNTTATGPSYSFAVTLTGQTQVVVATNLAVGAIGWLYLDSITTSSATSLTNIIVNYSLKP